MAELHQIAAYGEFETLREKLDALPEASRRPMANLQDYYGMTPLMEAGKQGHVQTAEVLLQYGGDVSIRDKTNRTALHYACAGGYLPFVRFLLDRGADVNPQDFKGETPLHWASKHDHQDIVNLLISKGADTSLKDAQGKLGLSWASAFKSDKVEPRFPAIGTGIPSTDVTMEGTEVEEEKSLSALESKPASSVYATLSPTEDEMIDTASASARRQLRGPWRDDDDDEVITLGKPKSWGPTEEFAGFRKPKQPEQLHKHSSMTSVDSTLGPELCHT